MYLKKSTPTRFGINAEVWKLFNTLSLKPTEVGYEVSGDLSLYAVEPEGQLASTTDQLDNIKFTVSTDSIDLAVIYQAILALHATEGYATQGVMGDVNLADAVLIA